MDSAFWDLHQTGTFVLVNVHDAGSAVVAEAAGAEAVGTSSSAHAHSLARPDTRGAVTRVEALRHAEQICAAVDIPVSIDAENGWGHTPEEVAATITDLAAVGAAGASIEDWSGDPDLALYEPGLAAERIQAAVAAAEQCPDRFVICARADGFLHDPAASLDDVLARLQTFAATGAHCLYAPGIADRASLQQVVDTVRGPVNALAPYLPDLTLDDYRDIGVRRVSVGGWLYGITLAVFDQHVRHLLGDGELRTGVRPLGGDRFEALLTRHPHRAT